MTINTKVDICNLALGFLGNYGTILNIDNPTDDNERTFALWYDICRDFTLKLMMPNFALKRTIVSQLSETPAFGYAYYYEYPNQCLKVLGVGNIEDRENNYVIEGNKIAHDTDYSTGMPIRIIKKITDINSFSPEYIILLAQYLSAYTSLTITGDTQKSAKLMAELPAAISSASGLNAQENRPIRKSRSKFLEARTVGFPQSTDKK